MALTIFESLSGLSLGVLVVALGTVLVVAVAPLVEPPFQVEDSKKAKT